MTTYSFYVWQDTGTDHEGQQVDRNKKGCTNAKQDQQVVWYIICYVDLHQCNLKQNITCLYYQMQNNSIFYGYSATH